CAALFHQLQAALVQSDGVREHCAAVESVHLIEVEDFSLGLAVDAFAEMQNKRPIGRRELEAQGYVAAEFKRMRPAELLQNTHWKIAVENGILARVVMADGGDSAEEIFQAAPKQSCVF